MWAFNEEEMREYAKEHAAAAGLDVQTYLSRQLRLQAQGEEVGNLLHLEEVEAYIALFPA